MNADYVAASASDDDVIYTAKPMTFKDIWKDQSTHKFAVQPPAFGTAGAGLGQGRPAGTNMTLGFPASNPYVSLDWLAEDSTFSSVVTIPGVAEYLLHSAAYAALPLGDLPNGASAGKVYRDIAVRIRCVSVLQVKDAKL